MNKQKIVEIKEYDIEKAHLRGLKINQIIDTKSTIEYNAFRERCVKVYVCLVEELENGKEEN